MANGFGAPAAKRTVGCRHDAKLGSRRIFAPQFKLQVLDSYRHDSDCRGNQRATARKYGIHRRQIQKWLQAESALRGAAVRQQTRPRAPSPPARPVDLSLRRPASPEHLEQHPAAWDLSLRRKCGYEPEAPPPPPPPPAAPRVLRLFRPYLPEDNFEYIPLVASVAPLSPASPSSSLDDYRRYGPPVS